AAVTTARQLGELPPRAALLTAHFESAFLVGYQRLVEGRRPDVAWAHLGFLGHPGAHQRLAAAEPAWQPLFASGLAAQSFALLDRRRPLRLEPDPHLAPALRAHLVAAGATWKLADPSASAGPAVIPPPPLAFVEAAAD